MIPLEERHSNFNMLRLMVEGLGPVTVTNLGIGWS